MQIYEYLTRIEAILQSETWKVAKQHRLQPIQLQMLDYLQRCNRYSNNPTAVRHYFQLTKGTVSQSLKALEAKGYIRREADSKDKRKVHFVVTEAGQTLWQEVFPPSLLQATLAHREEIAEQSITALSNLLQAFQQQNQLETFGVCQTCQHFLRETEQQFRCGLTKELLLVAESLQICYEHEKGDS